jgi:hypothetical protein
VTAALSATAAGEVKVRVCPDFVSVPSAVPFSVPPEMPAIDVLPGNTTWIDEVVFRSHWVVLGI